MSIIRSFRKANKLTIQKKLNALAKDKGVYSESIVFPDSLPMYYAYSAYIQGDEIVFLLNDHCHTKEVVQADERSLMGGPPMYFADDHCWTSPVYIVRLLYHAYMEVMRKAERKAGYVHCVVLTSARINNREDMEDLWGWLDVTVIDDASCEIRTAVNGHDKEKELMNFFLGNIDQATWTLDPEYDRVVEDYLPLEERMWRWAEEEMRQEIECERIPWDDYDDED